MRNGLINATSTLNDALGVLTGEWREYDSKGWHVVRTPFFTVLSGTFAKGPQLFPVAIRRDCLAMWVNATSSGVVHIKVKDETIALPENAFVQVTIFGNDSAQV